MIVDIKDITGKTRFSTPINVGSKRKFLLMKEDYITLFFSLEAPIYFHLGDIVDNELGIFELVDLYKPTYNNSTCGYDYELRLDAYYWKWKNKKFFYTPEIVGGEAGWNLTATLDVHLNVFLKNLKALGYKYRDQDFIFAMDSTVANASKFVSYDNVSLIDALTQMAETWECEWWITNNIINFGRCEYNKEYPVEFKLGDNVNTMQRSDSQSTYATRIYAFGSTRNIPVRYRKKLVFSVTSFDNGCIKDATRSLSANYFGVQTVDEQSVEFMKAGDPDNSTSMEQTVAIDDLPAGSYSFEGENLIARVLRGSMFSLIKGKMKVTLTIVGKNSGKSISYVIFEKSISSVEGRAVPILNGTFIIDRGLVECFAILRINIDYKKRSRFIFEGSLNIKLGGQSVDTSVTFLSGSLIGKTYQGVFNPEKQVDTDVTLLSLGIDECPDIGDQYMFNNICEYKVPLHYFQSGTDDLVVNGVVQKRLMLPEGISYIDAYRYSPEGERINIGDERYDNLDNIEMPKEESLEEIAVFEDVYPKRVGTISVVTTKEYTDTIDNEDGTKTKEKWTAFRFQDNSLTFSKDYILPGEDVYMVFQSGTLSGMTFQVKFNPDNEQERNEDGSFDRVAQVFEIIRNEDYGRPLPDDILFPQTEHMEGENKVSADQYILYGFNPAFISESMLPDAELELKEKAEKYIRKSMIDPSTYDCEMNSCKIFNNGDVNLYEVGDCVNLVNKAYFEKDRKSRIIGYAYSLDIPYDHPIYTVGETAAYSRLGMIENKVDSLTYKGQNYSGSTIGGGGSAVYVIGVNDKTLSSDRNVFSSKKSLKTFLNKTEPDTAIGHVTFENGILVRKQEIMEAATMALIEENDAIVEELAIKSDVTTLGEINNVSKEADEPSETNDLIVRLAGASEWTVNTSLFADVSQLMEKVFPFTISFEGGGIYEKGSIRTINLTWDYDRDITSQSVNGETIAIDIRTKQYTDVVSDSTYNLSAVCDGQTYTKSTSVEFRLKKYYGVSAHETLTNEEVLALNGSWATRVQSSTIFDCTGGKYPYYILPTSMASGIQFWMGGLRNSDWTEEVRDITNTYGHTESYTIFRLNSIQTGVLNIEVK